MTRPHHHNRPHYHQGATSATPLLYPSARHPPPQVSRPFFHPLYILDYLFTFLLLGFSLYLDAVPEPFHREFQLNDPDIAYPRKGESVSRTMSWVMALGGAMLVVTLVWVVRLVWSFKGGDEEDWWSKEEGADEKQWWMEVVLKDVHHALLGTFLSVTLTFFMVTVTKLLVGRLRPDFLARCQPDPITLNCRSNDTSEIRKGHMSFPSGHASRTAAGLGFACWYLVAALGVGCFDGRRPEGRVWRVLICTLPLLVVLYVAVSRLQQNMHHWEDVSVGALLGFTISYICYRFYYPSICEGKGLAGRPKGGEGKGPQGEASEERPDV
ncbi:uncharacterized protein SPPG_01497 [Spizellomyces punctatus DAOM BR117]|uniref:Phosphatidic acid phosphatase type 2/haloperoxidase domain-containing protein n=1 Tax=Spizellomyces punctatus (strain DAOM BR117) TaxID=645134 RepID=A0A0L0HSJ8_SPIPD|nr:uncharacterized protein SPPG_01497 [Spizellomyces punctatus DAOM BR117]KND04052.1 hypothetical protein SPPG_01497 [Spizellomyces punctatus DAOM BR117]|eukprot:XP_016612091.1 hypothetical protein SPPG_01497 [Spizellomyces punctatus DAOM BR117]